MTLEQISELYAAIFSIAIAGKLNAFPSGAILVKNSYKN
jgi:hypothetical protein